MKTKIIKHLLSKENFSEHNFREIGNKLLKNEIQDSAITDFEYLGIDPHPEEGDYVNVWFIFKIE